MNLPLETPEQQRLIAVEEAWGRRRIMEPTMNEHRLDDFHARYALALCWPRAEVDSRAAPCITKESNVTPIKKKAQR